jgi:hypothetical protein
MADAKAQLAALARHAGRYRGAGRNHEDEDFMGTIEIAPVAEGSGLSVVFLARADDTVFHSETSLIAADEAGVLTLWNLGSNLGFLAPHRLVSWTEDESGPTAVFRVGSSDGAGFVEEITLSATAGSIGYAFAWGFPGNPMAARSSVVMTPLHP